MTSVSSIPVAMSGSPYPCSQAEQYGLNLVSQPQDSMLQIAPLRIPRSMDFNGCPNARCDEVRAHSSMQAYAVPSWPSAHHPAPVRLPCHISRALPS
ncbi:hypothetical protein OE88DRAFT_1650990 [Heliocybe sulcata]|uniref:Uncharacterized protein n=1 Tax=Heliocybe sulcata TaxID=5364 RepID=A0A5C3NIV5_9AGAM|nr:hypothetical protein OE88DRAFT_1650990 [Heliocybe sulcata]